MNEMKSWEILLPTSRASYQFAAETMNTGFSPFYLNYGYEPVTPIQLLWGNELTKTESVASFVQRVASDWKTSQAKSRQVSTPATKIS